MPNKIIYLNVTSGGGSSFAQTGEIVLDTRTLAANKNKFKTLVMNYGGMYAAQKQGTFSVWYMGGVKHGTNDNTLYHDNESYDYEPVYDSSSSYEKWLSVNFSDNLMNYISTSHTVKFWLNMQQGNSTGKEVGWSTTQKPELRLTYDLQEPTISNITFNNGNAMVDSDTTISWTSTYANKATVVVNGVNVGTVTGSSIAVDKKYFVVGTNNVTVTVYNEYSDNILGTISKSASASASKSYSTLVPTVSDVVLTNDGFLVDNPTKIEWKSTNQQAFSLLINDKVAVSGTTAKSITLPIGQHVKIGENKFILRITKNAVSGVANSAKTVEYSVTKTYNTLKPTVSNINITNEGFLIDNPTKVTWQSTNQHAFNIYSNDKLLGSGTTANTYTIPAGKLTIGTNTIRVEIIKNAVGNITGSKQTVHYDTNKDFTRIMPEISGLNLKGNNRDNENKLTWSSNNVTNHKVYINDKLQIETIEKSYTIPAGLLKTGVNTIKVEAIRVTSFDSVIVNEIISPTIIENTPLIYSLEPSNISQNIDEVITVSFTTNEFCDRWEASAASLQFSGTTAREFKVAANRFKKGRNEITVTTYYTPEWSNTEIRTTTRISSFNGYGKPELPVHDDLLVYNTATPEFSWSFDNQESNAQTAFQLKIIDSDGQTIVDKTINSSTNQYRINEPLNNDSTYIVMLSIKNKYDIWSDFATKIITTSFNDIPVLNIELHKDGNNVLINIDGEQTDDFSEARIYKMEENGDWLELAHALNSTDNVIDYLVKPNIKTSYKVRVFDLNGAYSDSEVKSITVNMKHYFLTNVEDRTEKQLDFVNMSTTINGNTITKLFAGTYKPTIYKSNVKYESGSLTITIPNNEAEDLINFIQRGKIFCFRNWKGKKLYGHFNVTDIGYPNPFVQELTVEYIEVKFNEYRMYSGKGRRTIIYLNGEYLLDGSLDMSGTAYLKTDEREVRF